MSPDQKPRWFERFRPDGRSEPHVARSDTGEIAVLDDGWFAYFKDGKWHDKISLFHEQLAEFTPVEDRDEVYRLFNEARAAFGLEREDPAWPETWLRWAFLSPGDQLIGSRASRILLVLAIAR